MIDKVQKIKEWISKEQDGLMDAQGNFEYPEHEGAYHILSNLDTYIDSIQEEPVSEDLEKTANNALEGLLDKYDLVGTGSCLEMFKLGAEWQKNQGVTKEAVIGMATEEISINISQSTLDALDLCAGDKVIIQIRKKED